MQKDQPYDSSLKSFLEGLAAQVIPELLAGAEVEEELNVEVLKPPLRADRVYRIRYKGEKCILQVELVETKGDSKIVYRLLEYYGILYRKHRKPIISVVIYPFRTAIPESPLRIVVGSEEVLTFHFYVIALWLLDVQSYVRRHVVSMYALLPTMQGATYDVLKQALDEMKEEYGERRKLAEQILLFDTFLQRTDTVLLKDKHKIEEYMDMFDSLLEESRFVRKKRAEGKIEGKIEGTMETLRQVIVEFVQTRFPSLATLAQQQVTHVNEPQRLHELVMQLAVIDREEAAQKLLKSLDH